MKAIRLIAADMDGTLIEWADGGARIDQAAGQALALAHARGILVGTASGRSVSDQRELVEGGGLSWGRPFPQFLIAREKFIYWLDGDSARDYSEWNRRRSEEMQRLAGRCEQHAERWLKRLAKAGLRSAWSNVEDDYGLEIGFPTPEQAAQACVLLAQWVTDLPLAAVHRNHTTANVVLRTGTKGVTLRALADDLGYAPAEVLAIGDSYNDLDMVNGANGLTGAVVGNADCELKQIVRAAGGLVAAAGYGAGLAEIIDAMLADMEAGGSG